MGKGDKKTKRGKIKSASYGNARDNNKKIKAKAKAKRVAKAKAKKSK